MEDPLVPTEVLVHSKSSEPNKTLLDSSSSQFSSQEQFTSTVLLSGAENNGVTYRGKSCFFYLIQLEEKKMLVPNTIQLLSTLFRKLCHKFHLTQTIVNKKGNKIKSSPETSASEVLFGSATLEVVQSVKILCPTSVKVRLSWYHPCNLDSSKVDSTLKETYRKRTKFVQMFTTSWEYMLEKIQPYLGEEEDKESEEYRRLDELSKGVISSKRLENMFVRVNVCHTETEWIAQNLRSSLQKMKRNFVKTCHTKVDTDHATALSSDTVSSRHDTTSRTANAHAKQDITKVVRFVGVQNSREYPLTKEDREARMPPGSSATMICGTLKPLRDIKTGLLKFSPRAATPQIYQVLLPTYDRNFITHATPQRGKVHINTSFDVIELATPVANLSLRAERDAFYRIGNQEEVERSSSRNLNLLDQKEKSYVAIEMDTMRKTRMIQRKDSPKRFKISS